MFFSFAGKPTSLAGIRFLELLGEDEMAFDNLYCVAFHMMDAQWLAKRASYMEFNVNHFSKLYPVHLIWCMNCVLSLIKNAVGCKFYFGFPGRFEVYKNAVRAWACTWRCHQRERFTSIQPLEKIVYFSFISSLTLPPPLFFFLNKLFYHISKTTPKILFFK